MQLHANNNEFRELYAQPNGQEPSDDANEHRLNQNAPNPSSTPKSKGVVVKKKQKNVNKIEPVSLLLKFIYSNLFSIQRVTHIVLY